MLHDQELDEHVRFVILGENKERFSDPRLCNALGMGICTSTLWFAHHGRYMHSSVFDEVTGLWRVPFSMHSSRQELEALVSYLDPAIIVPLCAPIIGGPAMVGGKCIGGPLIVGEKAMPAVPAVEKSIKRCKDETAWFFRPTSPLVEDDLAALLMGDYDRVPSTGGS